MSLQICQLRARRRRSHTFLGGISHNCPFGYANCECVSHSPRADLAHAENSTCGRRGDALGWQRPARKKHATHTHSVMSIPIPNSKTPLSGVCCAVGLLWTNAAKVTLNKSCQYSGVGLQISLGSRGSRERPGPTTHEEPHTGKMEWAEECQRSPKWPRGHACRRVRSPTILISVARGPAPVCAAAAGCVFARRPCVLSCLARTFARCVCRAAPGNEGQPDVPVPSDCWRPCTAALSVRLGRDPGVSQKPQLSFGDGLHGCSAASKTTRPGP